MCSSEEASVKRTYVGSAGSPMRSDTLVVVAAHGKEQVQDFLSAAGDAHPILVVRTDGDENGLPGNTEVTGKIITQTCPFRGFDTGAYLWAYWHYYAKKYLFLHDSLIPHGPDYADAFFSKMPPFGAVAWMGFPFPMWDSRNQELAARYTVGDASPPRGIFGPIFAATRESLDRLRDRQLLPPFPTHKEAAQGKEREWAIAFEEAAIPIHHLVEWFDPSGAAAGKLPCFTKVFAHRT